MNHLAFDVPPEKIEAYREKLIARGVEVTESQNYLLDPGTLQESAATVIARMKEAGVTSVIFNGDPIAPRDFTLWRLCVMSDSQTISNDSVEVRATRSRQRAPGCSGRAPHATAR